MLRNSYTMYAQDNVLILLESIGPQPGGKLPMWCGQAPLGGSKKLQKLRELGHDFFISLRAHEVA